MPKKFSADDLLQLYKQDRLVIHTMRPALIDQRPSHMRDDTSMMCGSILFYKGLHHEPSGSHVPNAVARFGDDSKSTVCATLHDLDRIFDHHEQLEQQKGGAAGQAFVYFTNSDTSDIAKRHGRDTPRNYLEARWQVTDPVHTQRGRSFDFRGFCSTMDHKEDRNMEKVGAEWNEIRAVLNLDNMVGLAYLHDPDQDVQHHLQLCSRLRQNFDDEFTMLVFKINEPGGCSGDLVTDNSRLVTMEEYLQQQGITL